MGYKSAEMVAEAREQTKVAPCDHKWSTAPAENASDLSTDSGSVLLDEGADLACEEAVPASSIPMGTRLAAF